MGIGDRVAISKDIWAKVKADYEAGTVEEEKAFSHLSKEYLIDRTTISKKAKKEEWKYGKNSHISHLESSAISQLAEANEEKSHLNHTEITSVEKKTQQLLDREIINNETIRIAKALQNKMLTALEFMDIEGLKPKEITGAMKDINDIVNPKENKIEVNNTNAQQSNTKEITYKVVK